MRAFLVPLLFIGACTRAAEPRKSDDPAPAPRRVLRVCADPNNMPFSNERGEGLENELARLVAHDLDAELETNFWAQRRGFVRNTLGSGLCDAVMGMIAGSERVETTRPIYRSSYVVVRRADPKARPFRSFDDARLRRARVGVHVIGDDYANSPPVHALSRRGIVANVVGYRLLGDYRRENPPARLVEAAGRGEIDLALVWGPIGGYFAARHDPPLAVDSLETDDEVVPTTFEIAIAVRRGNRALRDEIDSVVERRAGEIAALLERFHVPVTEVKR